MISLLKYLNHYKKETVLAPLFKMLEAIFDLLVPIVVASIIDDGIGKGDTTWVVKMFGVLILLAGLGLAFALTAQYFAAKAAAGFGTALRHDLFKHIQGLSYTELDKQGTSTLITRMTSDVNQVQSQVNMAIRLLLRSPFIVFGAMIMAFTVDVKMAFIFVVAIPVLSIIVFGIMLITIPMYKKVQQRLDKVMGSTRENLSGVRVIRAFNQEDEEIDRYNIENAYLNKIQIFVGKISTIMNPATYVVINVAIIAILWIGGGRVYTGNLSQGQIVALINYMSQILIELIKLANLIINLTKAFACASRIEDVFKIGSSMTDGTVKEGINNIDEVQFIDAALTYEGSNESSVEGINLTVKRGQVIGIIGGTGSGKTSLVNLIPRFYDTSKGNVLVEGVDVRDYDLTALRNKIGVVPQKALLFKGTIRSNLLWGNENATEEDLIRALKISQSYDFVMEKDKGIDAEVAQNGRNFSGGQRQRLTIARALVRNPQILILDDSSSALDYATDARLRHDLKDMGEVTVFIVSQRTASIIHADKIIVLDDGKVVGVGNHDELLSECTVYQEIHQSQFHSASQEGR